MLLQTLLHAVFPPHVSAGSEQQLFNLRQSETLPCVFNISGCVMVLVLLSLQSYFKVSFSPLSGISVLLLLACLIFLTEFKLPNIVYKRHSLSNFTCLKITYYYYHHYFSHQCAHPSGFNNGH